MIRIYCLLVRVRRVLHILRSYSRQDNGYLLCFVFFFFSSRRRHTRCSRDWSSDVCSSDLVGIQGNHRAVGELVERVRRVTPEQPYVGGFAEGPRQTREVAVGIPDQGRDQRTVLEMFAQRVHELVILEIGQKNLERGARSSNEGLDRGVVILTPAARMDEVEGHGGRGPDEVVEPLNESGEGGDAQDPERRAHFRRFDPSNECLTTLSGTWSPCRTVNTAFRRNPRSSSTTRWLLSRAIRQARDALGAPPPITARAAVTTCSGGSAIVASCAQVAQRRDGCCRSAVRSEEHTSELQSRLQL